ncbi:MAG: WS/DGAT domain-containing protein [Acidobacteriota bacterium]
MIEHIPQTQDVSGLEPVHPRDRVWLQDSPENLMVINSIWTLERIDAEALREVWQERVLDLVVDGVRPYDRFTWSLVAKGKRCFWRKATDFDLANHIFEIDDPIHTREGIQDYLGEHASQPLPMDHPPWQFRIIKDFDDRQSAVIIRMHHVLGDGMGLLPVLFKLMDIGDGHAQKPPTTRGVAGKMWQIMAKSILMAGPLLVDRAVRPADKSVYHGKALSGQKRFAWTPPIELSSVKATKNRLGATLNDVLVTVVAGGLQRYAARRPGEVPSSVRVSMPVNVRNPKATPTMDNRFGAVIVELPLDIKDTRQRLAEVKHRMDGLKRSVEPFVYYGITSVLLKTLPPALSQALVDFYARKCSAVMSNVPGPKESLSVAGRQVTGMLFWVPQRANIGLGISILSFNDEVRIGIYSDTSLIESPSELIDDMLAELEHITHRA